MTAALIAILAAAVIGGTPAEATYYHESLAGEVMRNGERYDPNALTAASNRFPLGSVLRVTHRENGKRVRVTVTDTGGGLGDYGIDLSYAAFGAIGEHRKGRLKVLIEEVEK